MKNAFGEMMESRQMWKMCLGPKSCMSGEVTANLLLTLESEFAFSVDLGVFTNPKHRCARVHKHILTHRFKNKYEALLYQNLQSEVNCTPCSPIIEPCKVCNPQNA